MTGLAVSGGPGLLKPKQTKIYDGAEAARVVGHCRE